MKTKTSNILLIYTGGTIGMVKDPETGALHAFDFENLLEHIPELKLLDCDITTTSITHPIDSSNMSPRVWVEIAEILEFNYQSFTGFVILHGSDTMSYTASALSFMLENLAKPVILTGSQLPIGDLRTDAKENLITSIQIAAKQHQGKPILNEVCLYFEYKLYRGNRTTKINTEHFEAFASLNYQPLAESGVHLKINNETLLKVKQGRALQVHKKLDSNVVIIKLFPGISIKVIQAIFNIEGLKGVVLETYGAGNVTTDDAFISILKNAITRGIHIVNVTQCFRGSVMIGHYETSTQLKNIGVISGKDITTEAAVCKLMYLLSQKIRPNLFKTIYETSLRGEMI